MAQVCQMCGEEGTQLLFRILGHRRIVFAPVAKMTDTWLEFRDVEGMKSPRIDGQSDWRPVRPGMDEQIAAPFR